MENKKVILKNGQAKVIDSERIKMLTDFLRRINKEGITKELKEEQVRAAKQDIKKERTHYFGKDKILGCFRKNNPKKNDMPEKSKDEVSR